MTPFAENIWIAEAPVSFLGLRLTAGMTVVRLPQPGAGLLLHSPVALTPERRAQVDALGPVRHLYVPNLLHHSWIADWAQAYPAARVHAPAGLARKRPNLRIDRTHGSDPEPAFAGIVDEVPVDGLRLGETALVVRPARTAIVADLIHNVGRPGHGWTATYTRMMGFYDRVALSRVIRWTGFSDCRAARRSLDQLLALDFDRLVVGHGRPLATGGKQALAAGYAWLGA